MAKATTRKTAAEPAGIAGAEPVETSVGELIATRQAEDHPEPKALITFNEINNAVGMGRGLAVSNFPDDPMTRLRMTSRATNGDIPSVKEHLDTPLNLKHFYVHTVDLYDESNGEVSTCPRTVLFDDKGNAFQCVSEGVARSLEQMVRMLGTDQFPAQLKVKFTEKGTSKRRKILLMEVV